MFNLFQPVRRWWRERIVGPVLPTYDRACEELGGVPWRPKPEATDRWFISDAQALKRSGSLPALDALSTDSYVLRKSLSEATKLLLLGGSALVVIVACVISLATSPLTSAQPATLSSANASTPAAPVLLAAVTPVPTSAATGLVPKSSAPHALAVAHPHLAITKRHVAARHRRR